MFVVVFVFVVVDVVVAVVVAVAVAAVGVFLVLVEDTVSQGKTHLVTVAPRKRWVTARGANRTSRIAIVFVGIVERVILDAVACFCLFFSLLYCIIYPFLPTYLLWW